MARFDPMNVAVDWLDAYQDASLNRIVAMHSRDAVIECACGEPKNIVGRKAISEHWRQRFVDSPSLGLEVLKADNRLATVSYRTSKWTVQAVLEVASDGLITRCRCAPAVHVRAERDWPYVLSLAATVTMGIVAVSVLLFAM